MDPILGGIIKGGLSLLGGLFGGKKTTTTRTDFLQLRKDAEAAGFNPLTALKATGGAGNTTVRHPGLASGEALAIALGEGFDSWAAYDPHAVERGRLEVELMRKQLGQLQAPNPAAVRAGFLDVPQATKVPVRSPRHSADMIPAPTAPLQLGSEELRPASGIAPAQDYEDRYGDVVGGVFGTLAGIGDLASHYVRRYRESAAYQQQQTAKWGPTWAAEDRAKRQAQERRLEENMAKRAEMLAPWP